MFPASSSSFRSYDNVSRWSPRHNQLRTLVDATENWSVIGFISNKKERKRRRELNRYHKWQNRLNIPSSSSWDKKCQQLEKWFLFHRHSFFKPASHRIQTKNRQLYSTVGIEKNATLVRLQMFKDHYYILQIDLCMKSWI
jgi:hypothetical protein